MAIEWSSSTVQRLIIVLLVMMTSAIIGCSSDSATASRPAQQLNPRDAVVHAAPVQAAQGEDTTPATNCLQLPRIIERIELVDGESVDIPSDEAGSSEGAILTTFRQDNLPFMFKVKVFGASGHDEFTYFGYGPHDVFVEIRSFMFAYADDSKDKWNVPIKQYGLDILICDDQLAGRWVPASFLDFEETDMAIMELVLTRYRDGLSRVSSRGDN